MSLTRETAHESDSGDCSIQVLYLDICFVLLIQQFGTENTCEVASFQELILTIIGKEKRIVRKNYFKSIANVLVPNRHVYIIIMNS